MIALGEAECCALAGTDCRPTPLRRRTGRPQLKRDPLGARQLLFDDVLMPVSSSFRTFIVDQLSRVAPRVRTRSMFGGVGIYSGDLFFALIADDALYFKVDDSNRGDFEARGMGPFRPYGDNGETMQYYQVAEDLVEDPDALRPWAEKAIAVAGRKRAKRPRRGGA